MASSRGTHSLSPGTKSTGNKFVNDGSFLEMFKKQMEKKGEVSEPSTSKTDTSTDQETKPSASSSTTKPTQATADKQPVLPLVGKRRGVRPLKTGIVAKKPKPEKTDVASDGSAWSKYLEEVNQYKSRMCIDEDQSRPLVK